MAHTFGIPHDDPLDCLCSGKECIMSFVGSQDYFNYWWSECTLRQFSQIFEEKIFTCLYDFPEKLPFPSCGNGIKDEDEECDCGQARVCTNLCCDAITCKFMPNATCASGKCCNTETCQPFMERLQCRNAMGYCDLPEYCNGVSEFCPFDVFRQNGVPCGKGTNEESYCYNGYCRHNNQQCSLFYGIGTQSSHRSCYEFYNIQGYDIGHCAMNVLTYTFEKCPLEDAMCGMIHCNVSKGQNIFPFYARLFRDTPYSELKDEFGNFLHQCRGVIGKEKQPEIGLVRDGTKCGENAICVNRKCTKISFLNVPHCPDCHDQGVCNSLGQCHCDPGWAPPYCNVAGQGGSLHSWENCNYNALGCEDGNQRASEDSNENSFAMILFAPILIIIAMTITVVIWKKSKM